ncbi:hypothetical protein [Streptomyces sp. NBC_00385]|uniref:hypothetical protein n=1 Tax=Streptomyces sp. NBC_00385 TaxID=2975733 RepID=UPI002DD9B1F6|nr:hypothetical protein [Streptomyces sp. NBC_00385]WRZ02097.1 hypothetical protein OG959_01485 [Streptomyces sp. NBC_00385]
MEGGRELLPAHDIDFAPARLAGTHADRTHPAVGVEDLLVSAADKIWKNTRVPGPEEFGVAHPVQVGGRGPWEEFPALDDVLGRIAEVADARLAHQASVPVYG